MKTPTFLLLGFVMLAQLALLAVAPAPAVFASAATDDACAKLQLVDPDATCSDTVETAVTPLRDKVISALAFIVGSVSVIAMIYGGFRFVISNGDQNAVKQSKDTILYAVVGLVVALLAQAIVSFVLSNI
jgi:hypothetical protein